ncbi:unnamed protein product [Meganyctiphanes norvegica]|uniref:LRRCT domain-containing protein n=1 Tax=Meganyctiphanes norvegica TaxID=48144 RepID=A0AAV2PZE7_MEGNR
MPYQWVIRLWLCKAWLWMYLIQISRAFCPSGCTCDETVPSVSCEGAKMDVVPILLNPRIESLNLVDNEIRSVSQAFVFYEKLQKLDISNNRIHTLGSNNFEEQRRLQELLIARNNITELLLKSFSGLSDLILLDLSYNNIKNLPIGIFSQLPSLKFLLLAHNRLHTITVHTLRGIQSLHVLDLCDNIFRYVPTKALVELRNLKFLNLCRNRLTTIDALAFPNEALNKLSLESNSIQSIDDSAFSRLQQLQMLDLSDNFLSEVPTAALSTLTMLDSLKLSKNNFTRINSNTFQSLVNLKVLYVSWCPHFKSIHPMAFSKCTKLRTLKMAHNPLLTYIPPGLLSSLPRLHILDLRSNGLQGLSESSLPWASVASLDIRNNPLRCNCSLSWLANILAQPNASLATPDVQCHAPDKLKNVYLSRLSPGELQCPGRLHVIVGIIVVSFSCILIAALIIALFRFHKQHQREKNKQEWTPRTMQLWECDEGHHPSRRVVHNDYIHHHPGMSKSKMNGTPTDQLKHSYIIADEYEDHTYATIKKDTVTEI